MFRTLSELKDSIENLIEKQGEDAPCAAFIFTQEDVFEFVDGVENEEKHFPLVFSQDVLADVGGSSYIYEQVGEMIDGSISCRKNLSVYKDSN